MSVGSVCVLGEPWLELLADRPVLLLMPKLFVCLRNFSEACLFSFLNKGRFSTLSPQSAKVFLNTGYESGKFRTMSI